MHWILGLDTTALSLHTHTLNVLSKDFINNYTSLLVSSTYHPGPGSITLSST